MNHQVLELLDMVHFELFTICKSYESRTGLLQTVNCPGTCHCTEQRVGKEPEAVGHTIMEF